MVLHCKGNIISSLLKANVVFFYGEDSTDINENKK